MNRFLMAAALAAGLATAAPAFAQGPGCPNGGVVRMGVEPYSYCVINLLPDSEWICQR